LRLDAALYRPAPRAGPAKTAGRGSKASGYPLSSALGTRPHPLAGVSAALVRRRGPSAATGHGHGRGKPPVAIRWVLVRDPKKRFEPQALLSTDRTLSARQIVTYFIRRWSMETTFQEARLYLGLEGQRQWNDLAAARTTPIRLGLFSLVALIVQRQPAWQHAFRCSAWYRKARPTFADALAQVRRALWPRLGFWLSEAAIDKQKPTPILFEHLAELLAYVT